MGPSLGIRFVYGCAPRDHQFDNLTASPAASPTQRCGFQEVVAKVEAGAGVDGQGGKLHSFSFRHHLGVPGFSEGHDLMEEAAAETTFNVGIDAMGEYEPQAFRIGGAVEIVESIVWNRDSKCEAVR